MLLQIFWLQPYLPVFYRGIIQKALSWKLLFILILSHTDSRTWIFNLWYFHLHSPLALSLFHIFRLYSPARKPITSRIIFDQCIASNCSLSKVFVSFSWTSERVRQISSARFIPDLWSLTLDEHMKILFPYRSIQCFFLFSAWMLIDASVLLTSEVIFL